MRGGKNATCKTVLLAESKSGARSFSLRGDESAQDLEGAIAISAMAIDRKILIEACDPRNAETLHDRKARAVDNREVLIRKCFTNGPGGCQIGCRGKFNADTRAADVPPEALGR